MKDVAFEFDNRFAALVVMVILTVVVMMVMIVPVVVVILRNERLTDLDDRNGVGRLVTSTGTAHGIFFMSDVISGNYERSHPQFLSLQDLRERRLTGRTGRKQIGRLELQSAFHTPAAAGDDLHMAFGAIQHGLSHGGFPGEVERIHFNSRQGTDLQVDAVDLLGPMGAHLFFRQVDNAHDNGQFVHGRQLGSTGLLGALVAPEKEDGRNSHSDRHRNDVRRRSQVMSQFMSVKEAMSIVSKGQRGGQTQE